MPAGRENHTGKFFPFNARKGVTGRAKGLRGARDTAFAVVEKIRSDGAHFGRDIAAKRML